MAPIRTKDTSSINRVNVGEVALQDGSADELKNRNTATYAQKLTVLDFLRDPKRGDGNQSKTAQYFSSPAFLQANPGFPKVTQSSISRWRKQYDTIKVNAGDGQRKRQGVLKHPELEAALVYWINNGLSRGAVFSDELIKAQARKISDILGIPAEEQLMFSNGWVDSFKKRHQLRSDVLRGETGSVDREAVREEGDTEEGAPADPDEVILLQEEHHKSENILRQLRYIEEAIFMKPRTEKWLKMQQYVTELSRTFKEHANEQRK